jgi:hypothetical protein
MNIFVRLVILVLLPCATQAAVVIVNGLSHTHSLVSSEAKAQGLIRVRNDGNKESRILVYRQDLISKCGEKSTFPEAGSHPQSLGKSLVTNVNEKVIASKEEYDVLYSVQLGRDKPAGTYWEVLMVEVADPIREEPRNGVQVNSTVRYAIQVIVDVGTFDGPALSYQQVSFEKVSPTLSVLKVTLKNDGIFGARSSVILEVYDASGNKLKVTEPNSRMLYPGSCSTYEIPVTDLPKGKFDCVIVADTGKDLFGSNVTLQIE